MAQTTEKINPICTDCQKLGKECNGTTCQVMKKGRYFSSLRAYENANGKTYGIKNNPCIHVSGSVEGMRKLFWGYSCDVVRIGQWIYKAN